MNRTQTTQFRNSSTRTPSTSNPLAWGLLVAFFIAVGLITWLTFISVRDFVASWKMTKVEGIPVLQDDNATTAMPNAEGTSGPVVVDVNKPLQEIGPEPQPWDGASRVNVLVMGLDYRDWEAGEVASRTDTMIVLTLDPLTRSAGILNIPRDLWVNIPGFDYGKINQAFWFGQANQLPGGGPGLAIQTVEQFLGVPITFYAQIDFAAFEKFIDSIGGIEIDVPAEIKVDPIGPHNTVKLQPGKQMLNGPVALAYARQRYTEGGDFDRADRQQEVMMAILNRVTEPDRFPILLSKAPILYDELSSGVHTNMTLNQAIQLAWLVQQIPRENIMRGVIRPPDQVIMDVSPDGLDILIPVPDKIRELRDQIFTSSGSVGPAAAAGDPQQLMQAEAARVVIKNGSTTNGLAARTKDYLFSQGVNVIEATNADGVYNATTIIDYTGRPYTINFLKQLMGIQDANIYSSYDPNSQVDIAVILGVDWASNNPMP